MKKLTIILLTATLFAGCKKDENKIAESENGKTQTAEVENGEEDGQLAAADETAFSDTDSALKKNEDESYTFRYNLKNGETYPFKLVVNSNQSLTSNGKTIKVHSSRTVIFDYRVEKVQNNQFTINATFKKFAESSDSPMGQLSYDTDKAKPADKEVSISWSIYKAITGQNFNMVMNNKGKVISVTGLDKIIANVMTKIKGDFNAEEQKQIKELLDYSLSKESITSQFEESLNIFPDKSMKVGEKWEDTQNISEGPIKGQNRVTRTFKEIKDGKAIIVVDGVQEVSGTNVEPNSGITAAMKNKATTNGQVDLDYETGWIKSGKITKTESVNTTYSKGEQKETETGTQTIVTTVN
ncbi:MAG: DUF6263 family protein [Moheibacter sp.]